MRRLGLALLVLGAPAALAFPVSIQPRGSSVGAPTLSNLSAAMTAGAAAGTGIVTPTVQGLAGCSWSLNPTTYFQQSSSTGLISATSTPTTAGTYTPTTTCSRAGGGQTVAVSAALTIIATSAGGGAGGALDFSDPAQSGLLSIL